MKKDSIQSLGGKARAEALTPEQRSQIAQNAAATRWGIAKATHEGVLPLGAVEIPCFVLEDGTRVISQRGLQASVGMSTGGSVHIGTRRLIAFADQFGAKGMSVNELTVRLNNAIVFQPPHGGRSGYGYEATVLTDICEFILKCRDQGLIKTTRQKHYAKASEIILRSLAKVGIIALIDEVTNYQEVRDSMALRAIVDKYITGEWEKWTKTFPNEFYEELFRLKGISLPLSAGSKKPSYVGHWTNDIVYSRLAPGVLTELRRVNPVISGARKHKFFQYLTTDIGNPALREHLTRVIFLMRACSSYQEFQRLLNRAAQKFGDTIPMDL